MSNVAYLPISADRYQPCVRQIYIAGLDLTGVPMRAQIRSGGDVPGSALVDLQTVTNGNAQGLRLVGVDTVNGLPNSHVELIINESTMEALPYAGEIGDVTPLAWDWQITLAGRKQRIAKGEFLILGDGVTGADVAPSNRPMAYGYRTLSAGGMRDGATLTFGSQTVEVRVDGANLLAPLSAAASASAASAEVSAQSADMAAATALAGSRYFPSRAAGEAASAVDQAFSTDDSAGSVIYYRRTAGGSVEIGRAVTPGTLASAGGAAFVGFDGATVMSKLREIVSVTDRRFAGGADPTGAADSTAAFAAARDSGARKVLVPTGQYILDNLDLLVDYQEWDFGGAIVSKLHNVPLLTISGRGVEVLGGQFTGQGLSSNNIEVTGQEAKLYVMSCRGTMGRPLKLINASSCIIFGGIYKTDDTTGSGYDIEIYNSGAGSLYNRIFGVSTNQNGGGLLINGAGATHCVGNQMGKLKTQNVGGGFFAANRFGGDVSIQASSANFAANNFAQNITFGDGLSGNIGNIGFGPENFCQTGKTITIHSNVIESSFHLLQVSHPSNTININGYNNDIWCRERDTPVWLMSQSGSPSFGGGTLIARLGCAGRRRYLTFDYTLASDSSMGSGTYFCIKVPYQAKNTVTTGVQATDAGTGFFTMTARQLAGSDEIHFFPSSGGTTAAASEANSVYPFPWANGDRIVFSINAEMSL